jgi:hypothetical protein
MKPKAEKFPIAAKAGSSIVKIYRDRKPSGDYFGVVYHLGGKRQRLNFPGLEAAKTEAAAKVAQLARGDVDAVQLTGKDQLAYGRSTPLRISEFRLMPRRLTTPKRARFLLVTRFRTRCGFSCEITARALPRDSPPRHSKLRRRLLKALS